MYEFFRFVINIVILLLDIDIDVYIPKLRARTPHLYRHYTAQMLYALYWELILMRLIRLELCSVCEKSMITCSYYVYKCCLTEAKLLSHLINLIIQ